MHIVGADSLVMADRLVLVGEMHGTKEVPLAIAALAAAASGPVRVGIELPIQEQAGLDAFMAGGELAARSAFWRTHDGRSSVAMVELLHALRARPDTRVFAFVGDETSTRTHDEVMADHVLVRYDAEPHAAFLVLAGNMHTRTRRGEAPCFDTLLMGEVLAAQAPVVAFDASYRRGTAWNHRFTSEGDPGTIGVHELGGTDHGDTPCVRWFSRPDERGYDGELYLADVEASPPYVAIGW